jgi:hypothetical protein
MKEIKLTSDEIRTLTGMLLVEQSELDDLINTANDRKDKQELELELVNVESIIKKLNK